jgi:tetraacyldisaccharide 4'-kinase
MIDTPMTGARTARFAERHWYRRSLVSCLLLPIAWMFGLLVRVRLGLYRTGILAVTKLRVPVIVVGNLTVGGTGKTPLVIWLAEHLRAAGWTPGIISRGYGARPSSGECGPREVTAASDARAHGDEPALMARRTGCPVWVSRDRVAAARALLAANPACNVLISDDGLQHYALARDAEIAVEDVRGHGNGWMLPAGPLREPSGRTVGATVANLPSGAPLPVRSGAVFRMMLAPSEFTRVNAGHEGPDRVVLDSLKGLKLHAVAGIGHPDRFFSTLRAMGLGFVPHPFPDHHAFVEGDLDFPDCDAILMTEKDAVKCAHLSTHDMLALRVDAEPDAALVEWVLARIAGHRQ